MKTLQELTRPNIWKLKPYSSARDEYKGVTASVFLDANENPYNLPHNRYPDPMQWELKTELSKIKKVSPEHIFLGNGSDSYRSHPLGPYGGKDDTGSDDELF